MAGKKPQGLENAKYSKVVKFHPSHLCIIGLDTKDGPEHPDYDSRVELPLNPDMVESIRENGVQQVVDIAIVDGQPVVIDGRQRVRHAREAGVDEVTCQVKRLDDVARARYAIIANAFRQNDDHVTEAEKARRLEAMVETDKEGSEVRLVSDEQICKDFGWSIGTLRNRRKLVDGTLPKTVLNMVKAGKLTVSAAMALHKSASTEEGWTAEDIITEAKELAEGGTSKQAARARSNSTKTDGVVRPGIRLMAKIVANEEAAKPEDRHLSDDARAILKWVLGGREASTINGLTKAIKGTAPEPKEKKKAPPRVTK